MSSDPGSIPMQEPLAFFLTWTTYGAWLPGDERGWVEKPGRFRQPDADLNHRSRARMAENEVTLDEEQRTIVEQTIIEHCQVREWYLYAVNCRTQHVHVVLAAADIDPADVMNQLKAWCTRRLKQHEKIKYGKVARKKWWTQRARKRQLFDEASLDAAVNYVIEGQERIEK